MSIYEESVPQLKKMLNNLDKWLETAEAYAQTKSFDPTVLLAARLAPDQYSLTRQIQNACDAAKMGTSRLAGKEAPKHPDTEQTIAEFHARIASTVAFLDTLKAEDFAGAETRKIVLPFLEGGALLGRDYFVEMVLPNFYFHLAHAYAILRHNGVELGKRSYIGTLTIQKP